MHRKTAIVLAVSSIFAAAPAFAAGESITIERDRLGDPAYVASLHEQIEEAATAECKVALGSSVFYSYQLPSCVEDTVAATVAEIGSPELSAYASSDSELSYAAAQ